MVFYDKEASFERGLDNSISYASRQAINPKEIESMWDKMRVFFISEKHPALLQFTF